MKNSIKIFLTYYFPKIFNILNLKYPIKELLLPLVCYADLGDDGGVGSELGGYLGVHFGILVLFVVDIYDLVLSSGYQKLGVISER